MLLLYLFVFLSSCSSRKETTDPYSEFNRCTTELNLSFDKNILNPTANFYRHHVVVDSDELHGMVVNFFQNLREPVWVVNRLLMWEFEFAFCSFFRFLINSTIGFFGFFDPAYKIGLTRKEVSHKNTLKKWGIPTGDYIVLPLLGPSSTRDTIAEPISYFMDPVNYFFMLPISIARAILEIIVMRYENNKIADVLLKNTTGAYTIMKSIYMQKFGYSP
jgi:phospholipid-binding lipoprotein MlaA